LLLLSFLFFGFASGGVQAVVPSRYEAIFILLSGTHRVALFNTGILRENTNKYWSKVWVFLIPLLGRTGKNRPLTILLTVT
jgi:hypothetical protein